MLEAHLVHDLLVKQRSDDLPHLGLGLGVGLGVGLGLGLGVG